MHKLIFTGRQGDRNKCHSITRDVKVDHTVINPDGTHTLYMISANPFSVVYTDLSGHVQEIFSNESAW